MTFARTGNAKLAIATATTSAPVIVRKYCIKIYPILARKISQAAFWGSKEARQLLKKEPEGQYFDG